MMLVSKVDAAKRFAMCVATMFSPGHPVITRFRAARKKQGGGPIERRRAARECCHAVERRNRARWNYGTIRNRFARRFRRAALLPHLMNVALLHDPESKQGLRAV